MTTVALLAGTETTPTCPMQTSPPPPPRGSGLLATVASPSGSFAQGDELDAAYKTRCQSSTVAQQKRT